MDRKRLREFTQIAHDSAFALLNIINDILDFSRMEVGKLELHVVPFILEDMVSGVEALLQDQANRKHIKLSSAIDSTIPALVCGDSPRLRQILINLVANALQFTSDGSVTLAARTSSTDRVRFEVRDTGIGIAPGVEKKLFEPFSQADGSITRKYGAPDSDWQSPPSWSALWAPGIRRPYRRCRKNRVTSGLFLSFRYYPSADVCILPRKGLGGFGVGTNVFHQLAGKIGDGGEDAAGDYVALDLREPYLDLVQPRRIRWGEVKPDLRVLQELLHRLGFGGGRFCHGPCRSSRPAPRKARGCRAGNIQTHAFQPGPATAAAPGRGGPEPESPSFHRRRIPRHAAADPCTAR
jgi:hypothetical protein